MSAVSNTVNAQEYRDYLLKKIGNLYILNVGANDNVKNFQIYNLFFEKTKRIPLLRIPVKTNRDYFGAVQVTQIFPEYCVVRIVARYMEEEPEGSKIVLVKRELPDELLQRAYNASGLSLPKELKEELEKKIEEAPEGETITKQFDLPIKDESFRPFSVGVGYFYDGKSISGPVAENMQSMLDAGIYDNSGVFSTEYSSFGGIGITISKMITSRFMLQGGLSYSKQKADLNTGADEGQQHVPGLKYIDSWNFELSNRIMNWSATLHYSKFEKALGYFTGSDIGRRYTPRFGLGVTYSSINVDMEEKIFVGYYDKISLDGIRLDNRTLVEKFTMGGIWGLNAVAGIDYYVQAGKLFFEINYQHWFSDNFDSNIPFRIGGEIFF
ncbi:hypothetical protein ACFL67_01490 [candidate division KSB1 bacterium]